MRKIKVKNQRGAKRELVRASSMLKKAWRMMACGDKRRGKEIYRASLEHCAEAEIYIIANGNEALGGLLNRVLVAGTVFEFVFCEDE